VLTPPLKWAGGKRWLAPAVEKLWRSVEARTLVEPFCGGLAISFGLRPEGARLNDVNPHLINFYHWISKGFDLSVELENDATVYYKNRARFNELISSGRGGSSEAAALFYYLNRTGYNGLCRFNSSGLFNVPFGRYVRIQYKSNFADYADQLRDWQFTNEDFEVTAVERGDFIYADPPYDVPFTQYSAGGFTWNDQVRLVTWLTRHDGPVVLSNQATERIIQLYSDHGFALTFLDAPRRINNTGDRTPAREVLATRGLP
jgi:DNA adenine methylase